MFVIRGLLFDLDGTLTRPVLDFPAIKQELGLPPDFHSILAWMETLDDAGRDEAAAILDRHERLAAEGAEPNAGFDDLLDCLARPRYADPDLDTPGDRLRVGVITRNSRPAAMITLERLGWQPDVLVTREDAPPKPAPDPVVLALHRLDLQPPETLMIGDFVDDMHAGRAAGVASTVFVTNGMAGRETTGADAIVTDLTELAEFLETTLGPI